MKGEADRAKRKKEKIPTRFQKSIFFPRLQSLILDVTFLFAPPYGLLVCVEISQLSGSPVFQLLSKVSHQPGKGVGR